MSQYGKSPYDFEGASAPAFFPGELGPVGPTLVPNFPAPLMLAPSIPTPGFPAMPPAFPSAFPSAAGTPLPSAPASAFSTPFGTVSGMPPAINDNQALEAIFGPVPSYATANTSHLHLPFKPPPYKDFVPSPAYFACSDEDRAYQIQARENYQNGRTTDPWRNEPLPQLIQRFEDLSFADQMRERGLRYQYNHLMTDAQRADMDRRRRERTATHEPELDEEIWNNSPGCRCTIL
ncbi:hypothetical protein TWF481_007675 [Arthrobotrys musiformis]|uniref:Uncharacterized protein n=1 Tax=Arthrobotrys musiformis TaxID=47236 RepID=A0AAV9WE74_9PEZI